MAMYAQRPRAILLAEIEGLPDDAYITSKHAAAFLDVPQQTLANWRCEFKGPAFAGARDFVRYRIKDLKAFMAQRTGGIVYKVDTDEVAAE
jgi:hypothetical protein